VISACSPGLPAGQAGSWPLGSDSESTVSLSVSAGQIMFRPYDSLAHQAPGPPFRRLQERTHAGETSFFGARHSSQSLARSFAGCGRNVLRWSP
jgi:hypothetical protein